MKNRNGFAAGSTAILLLLLLATARGGGSIDVVPDRSLINYSDTAAISPGSAPVSLTEENATASPMIDTAHADTVDGVLFSASSAVSSLRPGDVLRVKYRIRNNSMGTISYDFPSSCQFDLQVSDSKGTLVFSLLAANRCASTPARIMLAPGAEKTIELAAAALRLPKADTLTVKPMMAGYPLSGVPLKVVYRSGAVAVQPSALEGGNLSRPMLTFNNATKILTIRMSRPQRLSISAFVLTGKQVNKLATEKFLSAGTHQISFNNQKLGDGIVIFKVESAGFSETRTINLSH